MTHILDDFSAYIKYMCSDRRVYLQDSRKRYSSLNTYLNQLFDRCLPDNCLLVSCLLDRCLLNSRVGRAGEIYHPEKQRWFYPLPPREGKGVETDVGKRGKR